LAGTRLYNFHRRNCWFWPLVLADRPLLHGPRRTIRPAASGVRLDFERVVPWRPYDHKVDCRWAARDFRRRHYTSKIDRPTNLMRETNSELHFYMAETPNRAGRPQVRRAYGPNAKSLLVFDANARYSMIFIAGGLPSFGSGNRSSGTAEEAMAVVVGSLAHFGTYVVDEADKRSCFRSTVRHFQIGTVRITGGRLLSGAMSCALQTRTRQAVEWQQPSSSAQGSHPFHCTAACALDRFHRPPEQTNGGKSF
jgi:hypothetical protein